MQGGFAVYGEAKDSLSHLGRFVVDVYGNGPWRYDREPMGRKVGRLGIHFYWHDAKRVQGAIDKDISSAIGGRDSCIDAIPAPLLRTMLHQCIAAFCTLGSARIINHLYTEILGLG